MTDRPILFSGPMIRALLSGAKLQTRRLAWRVTKRRLGGGTYPRSTLWQKVRPGDHLWVRETWAPTTANPNIVFKADSRDLCGDFWTSVADDPSGVGWKPSIHMPRWASRLTLVVTETRMQRVQDMVRCDAIAEGAQWLEDAAGWTMDDKLVWGYPKEAFSGLWNSLHGPGSWEANPEVVALTFAVHQCNIDRMEAA